MGMNIIKINTDNFTLTVAMDEILSPIYQTTEKTVVQPIVMMGEQGIAFASHSIGSIESHGGMVSVEQCPFVGNGIFFHAERQIKLKEIFWYHIVDY